jgi:L-ascorbate metabolism protein UlaG (beta-lactamase superfamily)
MTGDARQGGALRRAATTGLAGVGLGLAAARTVGTVREAMGADPTGDRLRRVTASPQYRDGAFRNTVPASVLPAGTGGEVMRELLFGGQRRRPTGAVPLARDEAAPAGQAAITWYGHATALVQTPAGRVLLDPVWSQRCSPSAAVGPRRLHPVPVPVRGLPPLDAVLISHDHYDHLDLPTIRELVATQHAPFLVPLGVGAHLDRWGVPAQRIVELDWHDSVRAGGLTLTATPARHFSGRGLHRDRTLWCSWVVDGGGSRVFYTGDSGYFDGYAGIGERYGPFDATLIQIGAYADAWPDIHMTPEEGVATHLDVRGGLMIPVHWATFNLALHAWREPADRVWREAKARGVSLAVPRPGERVDLADPPPVDGWWQGIA